MPAGSVFGSVSSSSLRSRVRQHGEVGEEPGKIPEMFFAFDLAARLPSIDRLVGNPTEMTLAFLGRPVAVSGLDGRGGLVGAGWVRFSCGGFGTEEKARDFAVELRERLRLAAVRGKFGIAIDDRVEQARIVQTVDEATGELRSARSITDGIRTFEETGADTLVWALPLSAERRYGPELLEQHLEAVAGLAWPSHNERLSLACDLLNGVDFESTVRARFIRLVTALEALAGERPEHSAPLVALLRRWRKELEEVDGSALPDGELASFRGQLRDIQQVSIKTAVRSLVARHAPGPTDDDSNERFVARCYDRRSLMLHEGVEADEGDQLGRLRVIVEAAVLGVAAEASDARAGP